MVIAIVPVAGSAGESPAAAGGDAPVTITPLVNMRYTIGEDKITFSGTNTDSNATYLVLSGPNLDSNGVRIDKNWPGKYPVTDGDASTFMAASVGPDNTWSYTWDTHDVAIDSGLYTVYAASTPRDIPHINSSHFTRISFLLVPPKDRNMPMVKIAPLEDPRYFIGEDTITFSGINTASNTTYLILSGPNLDINGSQIQKDWPGKYPVTDGDASTFMAISVTPDNTWSYTWDTHNVAIDSGLYMVYAASTPRDIPHINSTHSNTISFIMRPPKDVVPPIEEVTRSSESVPGLQDQVAGAQNQSVAGQTRNIGDSGNLLDHAWGFLSGIF